MQCHRIRARYELLTKLPLNSNLRRVALQSYYATIAPAVGDEHVRSTMRVVGAPENRNVRLGLRAAARRMQRIEELFVEAGDTALSEVALREVSLSGAGAHTGITRSSPTLTPDQLRHRAWIKDTWDHKKSSLHQLFRVSPNARDTIRYRTSPEEEWQ